MLLTGPDAGATDDVTNSLRSGHTTLAASVALAVFLVSSARMRPIAAIGGWTFSAAVGLLLLSSRWHRPSDIVAAYTVVAVWGCLAGIASAMVSARRGLWPAPEMPGPGMSRALRVLWWLAGGFAAISAMAFVVVCTAIDHDGAHAKIAFLGGAAAIVAACSAYAALCERLFRHLE